MAATNYTPIQLYYSTTAGHVPVYTNLVDGELAINTADGKLFYKDGTTVKVIAGTGGTGIVAGSTGQVQFNNAGVFGASNNFFWDNSNNRLGINTATPAVSVAISGTDAILIPKGTSAQQPTGVAGYLRFNTDTSTFEGYNGSAWTTVGGAAITNDTSTSSNIYPLLASATTGNATTVYTSNAKLLYKPSTGEFTSTTFIAGSGFYLNPQTIPASYTVPAGYSASSVGPITIPSGMSVTVSAGSRWVVL